MPFLIVSTNHICQIFFVRAVKTPLLCSEFSPKMTQPGIEHGNSRIQSEHDDHYTTESTYACITTSSLLHLPYMHEPSSQSHNSRQCNPLKEFSSQVSCAHFSWITRCHAIGGNDQPTKYISRKDLPLKIGPLMSIGA